LESELLFAAMTTIDPSLPPACATGAETEVYGNACPGEKEKSGDSSHN
jgi:hypothetical protein